MILHSKSWYPKSEIFISDLEKINNLKLEPHMTNDGVWIGQPSTYIIYEGFDNEKLETLFARHSHKAYEEMPPQKNTESFLEKVKKSFKKKSLDEIFEDALKQAAKLKPHIEANPRISALSKTSFDRTELCGYKSPLIEYLSYELDIDFREGSVDD